MVAPDIALWILALNIAATVSWEGPIIALVIVFEFSYAALESRKIGKGSP